MRGRLTVVLVASSLFASLVVPSALLASDELALPVKSERVEGVLDDAKAVVTAATRSERAEESKVTGRSRLAASGGSAAVGVGDNFYDPKNLTIETGTTVTWTNQGEIQHTVTADDGSFDSDTLDPGASFSHTLSQAGTIPYHCEFHAEQVGTIEVTSGGGGSGGGGAGGGDGGGNGSSTTAGDDVTGPGSESAAGESAGAAGSASKLPATGQSEMPLLIVGAALLGLGALVRRARRLRSPS